MAASTTSPKPKTDRKMIGWVFAIAMVVLIVYLLLSKGGDLGQSGVTAKRAEIAKSEEKKRYAARINNPASSSSAEFQKAQQVVASRRAAAAVPPPPMGVNEPASALSPPAPADADKAVSQLQLGRLERARKAADASPDGQSDGGSSAGFVMYQAGVESKKSGSIADQAKSTLDLRRDGGDRQDIENVEPPDIEKDPEVIRAKAKLAEYQAQQKAQAAASGGGEGAASPSENNEKWLFDRQDDKVEASKSIMATRAKGLFWLAPGTVINAVVMNAIDTRLPGHVTARVTQTTYDSRYGRYVVIPAGSVLQGQYNSSVSDGQKRVLLAFDTMVTPAGGVVDLSGLSGGDSLGRSGIPGKLHTHFLARMSIATLLAAEAVGMDRLSKQTQVISGTGQSGPPPTSSGGQIIVNAANEELKRRFAVGPNITIKEGSPMTITTTTGIEIPPIANAR